MAIEKQDKDKAVQDVKQEDTVVEKKETKAQPKAKKDVAKKDNKPKKPLVSVDSFINQIHRYYSGATSVGISGFKAYVRQKDAYYQKDYKAFVPYVEEYFDVDIDK